MHSLKSTGIAVLLLAISVGLYNYSANDQSASNIDLTTELGVSDGSMPGFGTPPPFGQQQTYSQQQAYNPQQPFGAQQPYGAPRPSGQIQNGQMQNDQMQIPSGNYPFVGGSSTSTPHNSSNFQPPLQGQTAGQMPLYNNRAQRQIPGQLASSPFDPSQQRYPELTSAADAPTTAPQLSQSNTPALQPTAGSVPDFEALRSKFAQTANDTIDSANQRVNEFRSDADAMRSNIGDRVDEFQQSMPDLNSATATTRQTIDANRDEGLISALQSEMKNAEQNISIDTAGGDFAAPQMPDATEIKLGKEFSNAPKSQFQAQPIELTDDAKNRLVSEQTPFATDFNVHQANMAPPSNSFDNSASTIDQAWIQVEQLVSDKKFKDALLLLTRFYRSDDLAAAQRTKLNDWLDALAGKVIYSTENHFTSTAYKMKTGETLAEIANRWNVPAQVVYNINRKQIGNTPQVTAGTELKMINGPFHAEVDLSTQTLTLYLKDLYAGRFPVTLGISGDPRPGDFNVVAKSVQGHTWRDADGNDFPPESPQNGYGPYWIGMTGSLCIHSVKEGEISGHSGCIGLSEKDAKDIFGILANRSVVKVIR